MKKILLAPRFLLALALVGLAVAYYDAYVLYNGQQLWCPPPINGCNEVASSRYARIFNLPVGYFGVVYYLYMHNASLVTLDDVMRHYEKGGIDRPSRSPLLVPIQLSDTERHDLVVFMETLTGDGEGPKPRH